MDKIVDRFWQPCHHSVFGLRSPPTFAFLKEKQKTVTSSVTRLGDLAQIGHHFNMMGDAFFLLFFHFQKAYKCVYTVNAA